MKRALNIFLVMLAVSLSGCATMTPSPPQSPVSQEPQPMESAARQSANHLFRQVQQQVAASNSLEPVQVVVEPFIDANTAEVTKTSKQIGQLLVEEATKTYPRLRFQTFSPENLAQAKYLLVGMVKLDNDAQAANIKHYRLSSSVVDLKSGEVLANAGAWISDLALDATADAIYQGSPMYLKDKRVNGLVQTAQSQPGAQADQDYFSSLTVSALLAEGDKAFEQKNYEQALDWYKQAEARPDGQVMKTFSALYQVYRKLGRSNEAEIAFGRLVSAGFSSKTISIKLIFSVGSTEFIHDADLRGQYAMWLRQIAQQLKKTTSCLQISGHSSRTGSEGFNESLSLQRALHVQRLIQRDFPQMPQRSTISGQGWKENIIGTGSDDMRDAIDRRVEFKIVDCRS